MQTQTRRRRSPRGRMPKWARCLIAILALVLLFYAAFQITLWVIGGTSGDTKQQDESGVVVTDNDPEKLKQKLEESEDTIAELESTIADLEAQLERYADKYGSLDEDTTPAPEDKAEPTVKPAATLTPKPTAKPATTAPTPKPTQAPTPKPTQAPTPKPTAAPLPTVEPKPTVDPGFLSEGGI